MTVLFVACAFYVSL